MIKMSPHGNRHSREYMTHDSTRQPVASGVDQMDEQKRKLINHHEADSIRPGWHLTRAIMHKSVESFQVHH